jgi:blue copper oxidase
MLGRKDAADLLVIASDGSLLERPVHVRRVRLSPGERIELLVDMPRERTFALMSYPVVANTVGDNNETFPIIGLRAGTPEASDIPVPQKLIRVPYWDPARASRTRTFTLDMSTMQIGPMPGPAMDGSMGINGRSMDMDHIDERVPLGNVEIWEIQNTTLLTHPFHIHEVQFRVLDRDGAPPQPHEQGLKDTVLVDPVGMVRVGKVCKARYHAYSHVSLPYSRARGRRNDGPVCRYLAPVDTHEQISSIALNNVRFSDDRRRP